MADAGVKARWNVFRFDEMATLVNDRVDNPEEAGVDRYVGLEHLDPESLRIRRFGSPSDVTATKLRFQEGDIIFGRRRVYQRKLAVADFDGICSAHAMVLRAKPVVVLPEFLPFFMQSDLFMDLAKEISVGSLSPTINWKTLAKQEFSLPSLEKQRHIAEVSIHADATIEQLLGVIDQLAVSEASLFNTVVMSTAAEVRPLGALLRTAPKNGFSAVEASESTGHWVLALSAITKYGYQPEKLKAVKRTREVVAAKLQQGDLVISRSNTLELVGLPAVFEEAREDVSRPDTMMLLQPKKEQLRTRFLELFLRSQQGRRQVQSYAAGTSASMKKINAANVQKVLVPTPSLEVQRQTEESTDAMRQSRIAVLQRIERTRALKSAFLREAIG